MSAASLPSEESERIAAAAARWVARRDAGLTEAECAALACWLQADSRHAQAFARFELAWSSLDHPGVAIVGELARRARRRRRGRAVAAVATLLLLCASGAWWSNQTPQTAPFAATPALAKEYVVPESRRLPDGSMVDLRQSAEIEVGFVSGGPRRVALRRGEAHFAVAKDATRPFVVETGGMRVRAIGTAFSVRQERGEVQVIVTEGRVAIESAAGLLATVDAGSRAVVPIDATSSAQATVAMLSIEASDAHLAWRVPRIEFSDTPLARAVELMNAAPRAPGEGRRLRLAIDPLAAEFGREPVSGLFRVGNAEAFVRVLELSLGVRSERRGDEIVLHKGR